MPNKIMLRSIVGTTRVINRAASSSAVAVNGVAPYRAMSATAGKPITCRAAVAWEKGKGKHHITAIITLFLVR